MNGDFTAEQKLYLEGFTSGLQAGRAARAGGNVAGHGPLAAPGGEPAGPDAAALKAQDRFLKAGKKLSDPEKFKRELHPFDGYEKLKSQTEKNEAPKPDDNFRWRFFGLFYCAPTQKTYMCRLRIPNGILKHWQMAGLADLADRYAGGYAHVTTRANLQMREIEPKNGVALVEAIQDLGLCSRGSGADNIRNVTGSPTAGIDPQELIDTRPYARDWHFHILNDRGLYGLPRKFNVGFDGAGAIAVLEDTNDIGFQAVQVKDAHGVEPGVWFRLLLGGITGHKDFARETGVIVKPAEATAVADAVVRVFIDHGDRTDRTKARLKYVLDAMGIERFLGLMEEKLGQQADARAARGDPAAPRLFDRDRPHRRARPEADRPQLDRRRAQRRPALAGADARPGQARPRPGRRRYPPHRLAEPADLRRAGRQGGAGPRRHRRTRPLHRGKLRPGRPRRLHRQQRVQVRRLRHQAARRGHRALVRHTRGAGRPGQHPSHRLPPLLRAALHRRHRPPRLQGRNQRRRRPGRGLSHPGRRRLRAGRRARPRGAPRREGRGRPARGGAHAQGVPGAPQPRPRSRSSPSRAGTRSTTCRACSRRRRPNDRDVASRAAPDAGPDPRDGARSRASSALWLNGFFAGLLSVEAEAGAAGLNGAAAGLQRLVDEDDGAPWHDAAMPIDERMQLAEGKPLPRRLFAAMAQQDCGQCGYLCETYSKAIADGAETKLNLCVPGGKETSRMLKSASGAGAGRARGAQVPDQRRRRQPKAPERGTRDAPVEAIFRMATRLNGKGSEKDTRHVVLDIAGSGLTYAPGDSFGLYPRNDPALADAVARRPCACRPISRSAASPSATR